MGAPRTVPALRQQLTDNLYHIHGQAIQSASQHDAYMALCYTVRDHLIDRWRKTTEAHYAANPKFVYYLSAEYLLGEQLAQDMLDTGTENLAREALQGTRVSLVDLQALDVEPGLGNGHVCRSSTRRDPVSSPRTGRSDSTARRSGASNPWPGGELALTRGAG